MKNTLRKYMYVLVNIDAYLYQKYYKLKNRKKKKLLIYTDSRGFEITKIRNRKHPRNSYVDYFVKNYNCDVYICTEKHTTFFDFFEVYEEKNKSYDKIICHIGVVDFSPRPSSTINVIFKIKKNKIIKQFGEEFYSKLLNQREYSTHYLGEKTSAIILEENITNIAEKLNKIDNLVWISCNKVDINWRGNYRQNRPENINMVHAKSELLIKKLKNEIELTDLTHLELEQVHKYTCDNIHLSVEGMQYIENEIKNKL